MPVKSGLLGAAAAGLGGRRKRAISRKARPAVASKSFLMKGKGAPAPGGGIRSSIKKKMQARKSITKPIGSRRRPSAPKRSKPITIGGVGNTGLKTNKKPTGGGGLGSL